jgi:hypothetical protein
MNSRLDPNPARLPITRATTPVAKQSTSCKSRRDSTGNRLFSQRGPILTAESAATSYNADDHIGGTARVSFGHFQQPQRSRLPPGISLPRRREGAKKCKEEKECEVEVSAH